MLDLAPFRVPAPRLSLQEPRSDVLSSTRRAGRDVRCYAEPDLHQRLGWVWSGYALSMVCDQLFRLSALRHSSSSRYLRAGPSNLPGGQRQECILWGGIWVPMKTAGDSCQFCRPTTLSTGAAQTGS